MKKKYWFVNSNFKKCQYWIESTMVDPDSDYFRDHKSLLFETIIEAKKNRHDRISNDIQKISKDIYNTEAKLKSLEHKKEKLLNQSLNPEIRD